MKFDEYHIKSVILSIIALIFLSWYESDWSPYYCILSIPEILAVFVGTILYTTMVTILMTVVFVSIPKMVKIEGDEDGNDKSVNQGSQLKGSKSEG